MCIKLFVLLLLSSSIIIILVFLCLPIQRHHFILLSYIHQCLQREWISIPSFECCLKSFIVWNSYSLRACRYEIYILWRRTTFQMFRQSYDCVLFYSSFVINVNVFVIVCISSTLTHRPNHAMSMYLYLYLYFLTCIPMSNTFTDTLYAYMYASEKRNILYMWRWTLHIRIESVHQHIDTAQGLSTIINTSSKANSMLNTKLQLHSRSTKRLKQQQQQQQHHN